MIKKINMLLNLLLFIAGSVKGLIEYHDEPTTYLFLQGTLSHSSVNRFLGITLTELLTDEHTMAAYAPGWERKFYGLEKNGYYWPTMWKTDDPFQYVEGIAVRLKKS